MSRELLSAAPDLFKVAVKKNSPKQALKKLSLKLQQKQLVFTSYFFWNFSAKMKRESCLLAWDQVFTPQKCPYIVNFVEIKYSTNIFFQRTFLLSEIFVDRPTFPKLFPPPQLLQTFLTAEQCIVKSVPLLLSSTASFRNLCALSSARLFRFSSN